ncbi:hypothetical protein HK102_013972, partial [Quaeritorhiza haematococci]
SSAKCVEDLRRGGVCVEVSEDTRRKGPRVRVKRHRAKKRSRPTRSATDNDLSGTDESLLPIEEYPALVSAVNAMPVVLSQQQTYTAVLLTPAPVFVAPPTPVVCNSKPQLVHPVANLPAATHIRLVVGDRQTASVQAVPEFTSSSTTETKRPSRPIVDICRDRRRRITGIRRRLPSLTRRAVAKRLNVNYSSPSRTSLKRVSFTPLWAQFSLQWTTFKPSLAELKDVLRSGAGNVIPVYSDIAADLLTPVSAYLKLAMSKPQESEKKSAKNSQQRSFLFESVAGGEKIGRYSFIGAAPYKILTAGHNGDIQGDPLSVLEKELADFKYVPMPGVEKMFTGGAVGYVSYDCVRYFEPKTAKVELKDTIKIPDAIFLFFDTIIIFDHLHHIMRVVSHFRTTEPDSLSDKEIESEYNRAKAEITRVIQLLETEHTPVPPQPPIALGEAPVSNIGKEGYESFVKRAQHYITEGDVIQLVPSQRLTKPTALHPFNAYRQLRSVNPSPYMFYLDVGDFQIVGASPEMLVKVEDGVVQTHPIAGTRKRGKTPEEDEALAQDLLGDIKERAEHVMLVDLGRNDVNRVCKPDTVKVDSLMHIERYSHVMHIVSNVSGKLREDKTPFDAFRSVFPAGTVSGAPKVRAMEIIYELEKDRRGIYAGAVGYFAYSGNLDTCIAIRTMLFKDGRVYLQAGGGIVYDSVPEAEYEETVNKLGSNLTAIKKAETYHHTLQQQKMNTLLHPSVY